jgi:hypothetical protein
MDHQVLVQIERFNSQGLANLYWAYTKLKHTPSAEVTNSPLYAIILASSGHIIPDSRKSLSLYVKTLAKNKKPAVGSNAVVAAIQKTKHF